MLLLIQRYYPGYITCERRSLKNPLHKDIYRLASQNKYVVSKLLHELTPQLKGPQFDIAIQFLYGYIAGGDATLALKAAKTNEATMCIGIDATLLTIGEIAGMLDSDGCIEIDCCRTNPAVKLTFTRKMSPNLLKAIQRKLMAGGSISTNGNLIYWSDKFEIVARKLLPYLIQKREQVELGLAFRTTTDPAKKKVMIQELKDLKHV